MKKKITQILVLLFTLLMVGANFAGATIKAKGSFSASDLKITINSKSYGLLEDAKPLIKVLGKYELSETISCAYDGMDRLYRFKGVDISTLPIKKGKDMIDEIIVTGKAYSTSKGIKVGDSKADIVGKYGNDYTETASVITYWLGEKEGLKTPCLYFEMKKGKVKAFGIYGARSAG